MNTSYYDKGVLVTNRRDIIQNYVNKRLKVDILSLSPFCIIYFVNACNIIQYEYNQYNHYNWLQLLFYFKFSHLKVLKNKIEDRYYKSKTISYTLQLLELLFTILFISHLIACLWLFVAKQEFNSNPNTKTWLLTKNANIMQEDWTVQFLYAYYFSAVTMITIGYGDITPQTNTEMIISLATMLISCGVFAYSVNQIGNILKEMQVEKQEIKDTFVTINKYMDKKKISQSLQYQIREYLEYYCKEGILNNRDKEQKIISMLSQPLKMNLMMDANKIALKDSQIFKNNFSPQFIEKIAVKIQECKYTPEQVIFLEGDIDDNQIYFVQEGQVEIFVESINQKGQTQIKQLYIFNEGQSFGEESFFTGMPRKFSIRSVDFTTLIYIKRDDFIDSLTNFQYDFEKFCHIKDNILLYQNFINVGIQCLSCKSLNHQFDQCPLIHYIPNIGRICRKFNIQELKEIKLRQQIQRKQKKYRTLANDEEVKNCQELYYENNNIDIDDYEKDFIKNQGSTLNYEAENKSVYNDDIFEKKYSIFDENQNKDENDNMEKINNNLNQSNCHDHVSQKAESVQEKLEQDLDQKQSISNYQTDKQQYIQTDPTDINSSLLENYNNNNQKKSEKNSNTQQRNKKHSFTTKLNQVQRRQSIRKIINQPKIIIEKTEQELSPTIIAFEKMQSLIKNNSEQEFDIMKNFVCYFPNNNFEVIIQMISFKKKHPRHLQRDNQQRMMHQMNQGNSSPRQQRKMDSIYQKYEMQKQEEEMLSSGSSQRKKQHNDSFLQPKSVEQIKDSQQKFINLKDLELNKCDTFNPDIPSKLKLIECK